jgi:hypothetical protein
MPSTTFDTLARPVLVHSAAFDALATPLLPEKVMYLKKSYFLHLGWTFLLIYCNKEKKFHIQILRQASQPNR